MFDNVILHEIDSYENLMFDHDYFVVLLHAFILSYLAFWYTFTVIAFPLHPVPGSSLINIYIGTKL